jgi:peroxiredoxin
MNTPNSKPKKTAMKTKEGAIGLMLIGLLATAAWISLTPNATQAPDVTFTTITGQRIELKALQGKPVLVTFWATDCPGCIQEIPHLLEVYNQYHPRGLEIIAVAMYYDVPSHVAAMTQAKQLPYHVALDLKAEHAKAFGEVRLTPTSFVIAPDGRVTMHKVGAFDLPDMKTRIETLLKETITKSDT